MITSRRHAFSEPEDAHPGAPLLSLFPRRPEDQGKPTLVLDMDETLLHSEEVQLSALGPVLANQHSFLVRFPDGTAVAVNPRPFLMEFLLAAKQRYELVVYTAGSEEYANLVLDRLDPSRTLFSHRLYRQHCQYVAFDQHQHGFVKDLDILGRDMRRLVCVDNMIQFVRQGGENGIPIPSYIDNPLDFALKNLMYLLLLLEQSLDVRQDLARMFL